ncbi:MAG: glycosyltransferase family 4 protein [Candidatus Eremiobacteraeota bacterium]|nr:glycosyltransferase family 4 protein [Candidatus Eremiobacteraeota bacterium]
MKHALFVAYHYPPEASSSGVLRTLKYTRYLGDHGWRVTVIAPRADAYAVVDSQLEAQIPTSVRILRTTYLNTKQHLSIGGVYPALLALPDPWVGWAPWAIAAGRRVLRDDPPDLIYSTSPHATAHLIAMRLAMSGLPWVTDFRDPWIEEPPEPGAPSGRLYRKINRHLEWRVVYRSNHIVTSTTHLRDVLRQRYPDLPSKKITAILNGYDEADFSGAPTPSGPASDHLLILHAGSVNPEFRDPRPLFTALQRLASSGAIDLDRIRLRFIGAGPFGDSQAVNAALAETGLASRTEFVPRVPYVEALHELARADMLLLLQASDDTVGLVPAKLYEYLRTQRPVLALVRPGATSEVLAITGGGWAVDPRDAKGLDAAITLAYRAWDTGELISKHADLTALRQFDRKALAGELAGVFDRLMSSPANTQLTRR